MSHNIIIDNRRLLCIDCVGSKPKNFQKVATIELYYYILDDEYTIRYEFHKIDFKLWITLLSIHKEYVDNYVLKDELGDPINEENIIEKEYYVFELSSNDSNLYKNIYFIPFIYYSDKENNMDEQMILNLWYMK